MCRINRANISAFATWLKVFCTQTANLPVGKKIEYNYYTKILILFNTPPVPANKFADVFVLIHVDVCMFTDQWRFFRRRRPETGFQIAVPICFIALFKSLMNKEVILNMDNLEVEAFIAQLKKALIIFQDTDPYSRLLVSCAR